jgi:poly(3-hydroxybutyrate) depolymerase
LTPAVQQRQITVDGVVRSYRVFAPPTVGSRQRTPLVVVLHGGGDSVQSTVDTTMFDQQAEKGNFVAVYPQGTRLEWNAGFCCGSAPERKVDDVGFLDQMLDRVEADYSIDTTRVFLTGVSNGAMLAYVYACQHADRVTAVGSVAGSMVLDTCRPSRPVSVLEVHGTQDPLVPYQGGHVDQSIVPGLTHDYPSAAALAPGAVERTGQRTGVDGDLDWMRPRLGGFPGLHCRRRSRLVRARSRHRRRSARRYRSDLAVLFEFAPEQLMPAAAFRY